MLGERIEDFKWRFLPHEWLRAGIPQFELERLSLGAPCNQVAVRRIHPKSFLWAGTRESYVSVAELSAALLSVPP
jgi:hypothetical protein